MLTIADTTPDAAILATADGLVRVVGEAEARAALTRLYGVQRAEATLGRLRVQRHHAAAGRGRIRSMCCDAARTVTMRKPRRRRPVVMVGTTPRR